MPASHNLYVQLPLFICNNVYIILYFVLMSPWGCWFIAETYRTAHVCGWFVILYKLCAFVVGCGEFVTIHGTNNLEMSLLFITMKLCICM